MAVALLVVACLLSLYHLLHPAHALQALSPTTKLLFCTMGGGVSHQERVAESCARIASRFGYAVVPLFARLTSDEVPSEQTIQKDGYPNRLRVDVDDFVRRFSTLCDLQDSEKFVQGIGAKVARLAREQRIVALDRWVTFPCVKEFFPDARTPRKKCHPIANENDTVRLLGQILANASTVLLHKPWINKFIHQWPGPTDWLRTPNRTLLVEAKAAVKGFGTDFDCLHARVEQQWSSSCCKSKPYDRVKCAEMNPSCLKLPEGIADWMQHSASPRVPLHRKLFISSGANMSDLAPLTTLFDVLTVPSVFAKMVPDSDKDFVCIRQATAAHAAASGRLCNGGV